MDEQSQTAAPVTATKSKSGGKIILIIVAILVVLGVGGTVVYARYFSKPGSFLSGVIPKALNPNCKYNDPDLCKFINNWPNVSDLTMTMTGTLEGKSNELIFKQSGKDKNEMISKVDGKENMHTISIDKTDYFLDFSDNKWWKYTPKPTDESTVKTTEESIDFDSPEDKSTYKKIGKEACGKLTCFKYQVIDPANTETTEYIYFDDKEYLLRKERSEAKDGSVTESLISYESVSISAPSPTKDGNPYDNANIINSLTGGAGLPATSSSGASSSSGSSVQTPADTTVPDVTDTPADSGDTPVDVAPSDSEQ